MNADEIQEEESASSHRFPERPVMFRAHSAVPMHAERLLRPQRIGIVGHRGVGKTTLLSMLYREASAGRLTGCRLAGRQLDHGWWASWRIQAAGPPTGGGCARLNSPERRQ